VATPAWQIEAPNWGRIQQANATDQIGPSNGHIRGQMPSHTIANQMNFPASSFTFFRKEYHFFDKGDDLIYPSGFAIDEEEVKQTK
jgi:hypothetical protein